VTLAFFTFYFVVSWIPKLANAAGLPLDQAIYAGASFNAGSFIGTALIGWVCLRIRISRAIACYFAGAIAAMLVFGSITMPVALTLLVAGCVGLFVNGGFNGFWGLAAALYPAEIRGTGIGWAMGTGRIGAVLGPIVGGYLVGANLPISVIFAIYTVPLAVSALLCLAIRGEQRS
jgi:MFS family permease